ncbi:MAG: hypothetical protein IPN17_26610 [Deltaproteobacteria bacterium]|nr:hypothetical protein [Deltaproteobacteria bacterium]
MRRRRSCAGLLTRHGLAARYLNAELVTEGLHVTAPYTMRSPRWRRHRAATGGGRWLTNRSGLSVEELCTWAVRRYRTHGRIERDHHLLEGPLAVRPLFVQNGAHPLAGGRLRVEADRVELMERQAPGALASMPKSGRPKASLVERIEAFFQSHRAGAIPRR